MRIKATEAQVMSTLRAVVAERPGYVYNAPEHMRTEDNGNECFYVHVDRHGGRPEAGCLIGAVLSRLGVPLAELAKWEHFGVSVMAGAVVEASVDVVSVLAIAQDRQDNGATWAKALAAAEHGAPAGIRV
jgi:hypothetical protein